MQPSTTSSRASGGSRSYDASGRRAEAQERRRRVVESARELFLEQGYASTSIADIARAAGVSAPMIYAAFDGKAGILGRVVDVAVGGDDEDILVRDRPESREAVSAADPAARLRAIAQQAARINERVGRVLEIVHSVSGADPSVAALRESLTEAIRSDTKTAAAASLRDLRPDLSVDEIADVLRLMAWHTTWHALVVEGGWSQERYAEWLGDALVRLLL